MTRLVVFACLAGGLGACIPASLLTGGAQERSNQCVADMKTTLDVPPEPPMGNMSGRYSCVFQGPEGNVTEYIDVRQRGDELNVQMHDLRGNSNIGRGHIGGNVLAFQYTAGNSGVRLEADGGGVIQGFVRWFNADDCSPHPYTCMRR